MKQLNNLSLRSAPKRKKTYFLAFTGLKIIKEKRSNVSVFPFFLTCKEGIFSCIMLTSENDSPKANAREINKIVTLFFSHSDKINSVFVEFQ